MDWFLYDNRLRHERVKLSIFHPYPSKDIIKFVCLFCFVCWFSLTLTLNLSQRLKSTEETVNHVLHLETLHCLELTTFFRKFGILI